MYRLDVWKRALGGAASVSYRRPDDTFWFTREDLRTTYIDHLEAVNEDRAAYWEVSEADLPTAPVIDPEPPAVGYLYTAIWHAATGETTVTEQPISLLRSEREPKASEPVLHPTDPGLPLTAIKWRRQVAREYDKITVVGTDRTAVEETLAIAGTTAARLGQLTAPEVLEAIAADSTAEDQMYFKPISTLEAELEAAVGVNFFGVMTAEVAECRRKLFAARAELRPKYVEALAKAREEAGLTDSDHDLAVDRALDSFQTYEERWDKGRAGQNADYVFPAPGVPGGVVYLPPPGTPAPLFGIPGIVPGSAQDPFGLSTPVITPLSSAAAREDFVTKSPIKIAAQMAAQFEARSEDLAKQSKPWLLDAVRAERSSGRTWDEVAVELGTSRQGAHQRFAKALEEEPAAEPDPGVEEDSMIGRFKKAVVERDRIEAEELIQQALSDVLGKLADYEAFPTAFMSSDAVGKYREFIAAARRYQDVVGPLLGMVVVGCRYAPAEFEELFTTVLIALAEPREPHQTVSYTLDGGELGVVPVMSTISGRLQELAMLPAALVMYGGMIAALEAKNFTLVRALALAPVRISLQRADTVAAFQRLLPELFIDGYDLMALRADQHPGQAVGDEYLRQLGAGELRTLRAYFRGSNFMYSALKDRVALPLGRFDEKFDQTEMLLGLLIVDARSYPQSWIGRYATSVANSPSFEFSTPGRYFSSAVSEGEQWGPLKAGMFGGSAERLNLAVYWQMVEINKLAGYGGRALGI